MDQFESLSLISEYDQNGIPWLWYEVCQALQQHGVQAIDQLFDYFQQYNHNFDPWVNYLLACSYFTEDELQFPTNRQSRRKLELKVRKLLSKHKSSIMTSNEFISKYKSELRS